MRVPLRGAGVRCKQGAELARKKLEADRPAVTDDWPAAVPVTGREIAVIETYLGALLDELLGEARAGDRSGTR